MDAESWFNAKKAVELGFADKIMFSDEKDDEEIEAVMFSRQAVTNSLLSILSKNNLTDDNDSEKKIPFNHLEKRLNLLKN